METVAKRLKIPMDKVLTNLDEHGNTSAGSIPIALNGAVKAGKNPKHIYFKKIQHPQNLIKNPVLVFHTTL